MRQQFSIGPFVSALGALLLLTACDKMMDTSRAVQSVAKNAFEETKGSWSDFLTYHPTPTPSSPQTRYCYRMQSDVVCYDSRQPMLTSKLVGYQDGENISWVQPGGGSLGASGGEPIALRTIAASEAAAKAEAGRSIPTPLELGMKNAGNFLRRNFDANEDSIEAVNLPPAK